MKSLAAIFTAIRDLFKQIGSWFRSAPSEDKRDKVEDVRDRHDKFKKGPQ